MIKNYILHKKDKQKLRMSEVLEQSPAVNH